MSERDEWGKRLNAASYKAQQAILSEISDFRKDVIVEEAILEIGQVAEEKAKYFATGGPAKTARGKNRVLFGQ